MHEGRRMHLAGVMVMMMAVVVVVAHGQCYNITYRDVPDALSHSCCEDISGCSDSAALPREYHEAMLAWGMGMAAWVGSSR
jgi:hypothetical protein